MDDDMAVAQAVRRLNDALDALDAALEMRVNDERQHGSVAEQVQAFSLDRARLAGELDDAQARVRALKDANREATRRLDEAMATIRAVIAPHERPDGSGHDHQTAVRGD
jgi:septal ring factor EnvC (AmiA/AmiB activator)